MEMMDAPTTDISEDIFDLSTVPFWKLAYPSLSPTQQKLVDFVPSSDRDEFLKILLSIKTLSIVPLTTTTTTPPSFATTTAIPIIASSTSLTTTTSVPADLKIELSTTTTPIIDLKLDTTPTDSYDQSISDIPTSSELSTFEIVQATSDIATPTATILTLLESPISEIPTLIESHAEHFRSMHDRMKILFDSKPCDFPSKMNDDFVILNLRPTDFNRHRQKFTYRSRPLKPPDDDDNRNFERPLAELIIDH